MASEIAFQIGFIVIGVIGLWQLRQGLAKWRVFAAASAWPETAATLTNQQLTHVDSKQLIDDPDDYIDKSYYHEVEQAPFFPTLTTRYYYPLLRFTYSHAGEIIQTDNLAPYNRKFIYFNREQAQAVLDQFAYSKPFSIRYNPHKSGEVFLGREHFPYWWAIIQTVGGLFFTLAFTITVEFVLGQLGLEEPRLGDRVISIYIIPMLVLLYWLGTVIYARMGLS